MSPEELRTWRKMHCWTQAQAAEMLGISARSMTTYETTGPVPKVVALACTAVSRYSEGALMTREPNIKKLVPEQHNDLGENYIVMPQYFLHGAPFGWAVRMQLSSGARKLVKTMEETRFSVKSVVDIDKRRYAVPVMIFGSNREMTRFYTAWL